MNQCYPEDWHFKIDVLKMGRENKADDCRLGLEPGDTFVSGCGTPVGFCPPSFIKIFPVMEVIRCQGDLRCLGASVTRISEYICPDGAERFRISGTKQE